VGFAELILVSFNYSLYLRFKALDCLSSDFSYLLALPFFSAYLFTGLPGVLVLPEFNSESFFHYFLLPASYMLSVLHRMIQILHFLTQSFLISKEVLNH